MMFHNKGYFCKPPETSMRRHAGACRRTALLILSGSLAFSLFAVFPVRGQSAQAANEGPPGPVESRLSQAYTLLEQGAQKEALNTFQAVLGQQPGNLPARLGQAMIYADRQQHDKAFSAFDQIVEYHPQHAFAWNGRGLAAFNLRDFDEALSSFERATADQPVNGFFYESLAWTQMCRGDYAKALESAKQATLMYGQKGESAAYPLLIAYFSNLETGEHREAKRTLNYAMRNKPAQNIWPQPVFDYLSGRIDSPELISCVVDSAQETEAHTYIGLQLRATGQADAAAPHFNWVAEHGDQRVFEYTLARTIHAKPKVAARMPIRQDTSRGYH